MKSAEVEYVQHVNQSTNQNARNVDTTSPSANQNARKKLMRSCRKCLRRRSGKKKKRKKKKTEDCKNVRIIFKLLDFSVSSMIYMVINGLKSSNYEIMADLCYCYLTFIRILPG